MVVVINVEIGNSLDDTTRNEILVCSSSDVNALNNLGAMADMYVQLAYDCELILSVRLVKAINVSTEESYYLEVKEKCFSK